MAKDELESVLDDEDAQKRFDSCKGQDPFPNIPPSLLNSADIHDYAVNTGMICPYEHDKRKSSSYEAQVGEWGYYWDKDKVKQEVELSTGAKIDLRPNSLIYLTTKQKFRLPNFMAVRFNLRIENVHKGLLLGTGPLVDPGYQGHLLIPLYNFTTNTYPFKMDDDFIWIEFNKTSPNAQWHQGWEPDDRLVGTYKEFPLERINQKAKYFFGKALDGGKYKELANAVPSIVERSEMAAEGAAENAKSARETSEAIKAKFERNLIIGLVGIALAVGAIIYGSFQVHTSAMGFVTESKEEFRLHLMEQHERIPATAELQLALDEVIAKLGEAKADRDALRNEVSEIRQQLEEREDGQE